MSSCLLLVRLVFVVVRDSRVGYLLFQSPTVWWMPARIGTGFTVPGSPFSSGRFGPTTPCTSLCVAMNHWLYQVQKLYTCPVMRLLKSSYAAVRVAVSELVRPLSRSASICGSLMWLKFTGESL